MIFFFQKKKNLLGWHNKENVTKNKFQIAIIRVTEVVWPKPTVGKQYFALVYVKNYKFKTYRKNRRVSSIVSRMRLYTGYKIVSHVWSWICQSSIQVPNWNQRHIKEGGPEDHASLSEKLLFTSTTPFSSKYYKKLMYKIYFTMMYLPKNMPSCRGTKVSSVKRFY